MHSAVLTKEYNSILARLSLLFLIVKTNLDRPDEYVVLFKDRSNFLDDTGRAQGVQQLKLYSA
jgi:hypothetical protein